MNSTKTAGIFSSLLLSLPIVHADMASGPTVITFAAIALAVVSLFVIGAVFLIRFIIRRIREKT